MKKDLTQGSIMKTILFLALPIMATSFLQMAYNMIDMIWIGRVGSSAVAAVGTAGFYMWLAMGFVRLTQVGVEVKVAQSIGKKEFKSARDYARSAIYFNLLNAVIYGSLVLIFKEELISFFNIEDAYVNEMAIKYLSIISVGLVFGFANPVFSGIYNGSGDSKTPLRFNGIGLVINMVLDPLLIFGIGFFPELGVVGAAIATIFSQMVVTILFIGHLESRNSPFLDFKFFIKPKLEKIMSLVKLGFPVAVQSLSFTLFAMLIARLIASWGPIPIAVQKVGSQIEAISWMTASGFSTALSAFTGQNFGAERWDRIYKGYFSSLGIMTVFGILASISLIVFAEPIFSIFIPEKEAIVQGAVYLRILGISQMFMCVEISTAGAFNGLGKTVPPSLVSIIFTGLRVPAAYLLSQPQLLGLNGVWWSISLSSIFKGIVVVGWFLILLKTIKKDKVLLEAV